MHQQFWILCNADRLVLFPVSLLCGLWWGGTSLYGVVPVAGSPSPLMYSGDYQFDWLCAYTVVLL